MTNTIVTTEAAAVNLVETTKAAYEAAVEARAAAFQDTLHANTTPEQFQAYRSAMVTQERARVEWAAASEALQALWRDEDAEYDAILCAKFDALDNAIDYPANYDASMPIPYVITTVGHTYLDHHYATHSNAGMLAEGGDSPYGDGTTGWDHPAPLPSYYQGDTPDLDERDRQEKLSY
ncbi:MAG: hypothetical protein H0X37_21305 [Herpetosiphonaceae bacterium]|nr:hypothetical protein [Herpetosiphonaceae bacterium]